jgi:KDO2-lipid IV(A) lauroyltransferase
MTIETKRTREREWLALAAVRGAGALLSRMPLGMAQGCARVLARAYLPLGGRRVRWARQNLRIAFPSWSETEREGVALASAEQFLFNFIDLCRSERWDESELLARFSFEGLELLATALCSGRGAVLLGLHMGCYDVGLRALSLRLPDLNVAVVSKPLSSKLAQRWLTQRRNGGSVETVAPGPRAALHALRVLRAGRPLIVLNDLYVRYGRRVEVPLFGARCLTSIGPALLAQRAGAPILPCYVVRDAPDHHILRILPELELPDAASPDAELAVTAACNRAIEDIIRKHPEHWTWAHRRFRYSSDVPAGMYRRV